MTKKDTLIAALRQANGNITSAMAAIEDRVGSEKALTWTRNVNGTRHPLTINEQKQKCVTELTRYARKMEFHGTPDADNGPAEDHDKLAKEAAERAEQAKQCALSSRNEADAKAEENELDQQNAERARAEAESAARDQREAMQKVREAGTEAEQQEAAEELADATQRSRRAEDNAREMEAEAERTGEQLVEMEAQAQQDERAAQEAEQAAKDAEQAAKDAAEQAEEKPEYTSEIARFLAEANRLRAFVQSRDNFDPFDSMRIENDGLNAIIHGEVPVDGILASLTATWSDETREQAEVPTYDYTAHGEAPEGVHSAAPYVLALLKANVPVWLHGPAGTGKSTCARYAAQALDLPYYEVNLSGSLPSAIKGRDRLKEFVEAEFCKAYEHGGIICMEEFGFAPVQTAAVINNAIANGHFHNDASGEVIERHENFRIVVTDNGLGTGATKDFQRNRLDGATLDRFRVGRVLIQRDERLVKSMIDAKLAAAGVEA